MRLYSTVMGADDNVCDVDDDDDDDDDSDGVADNVVGTSVEGGAAAGARNLMGRSAEVVRNNVR
jgi:hypothetical protein